MSSARSVRRRIIAWAAAAVMLLAALMPTLTHALASTEALPPTLLDICTTVSERVDAGTASNAADKHPEAPLAAQHAHCPFCLTFVDRLAALPAAIVSLAPAEAGAACPDAPENVVEALVHAPALPRGPPACS